jgi:UDPglucose--hexose-1-phosphate uridylyltransferase
MNATDGSGARSGERRRVRPERISVPEIRHDALTDRLVIVAADRAARPETFRKAVEPPPAHPPDCPFCPGHELETPPEVARLGTGDAEGPGWTLRIVPNLYPIVGGSIAGAHEVVVLSPAHNRSLGALDPRAAVDVFGAIRDRAAFHLAGGLAHVVPFVNHGKAAGASIEHPHAQLVALDFVPPAVNDDLARFERSGRDLVADSLSNARGSEYAVIDGPAPAWCSPGASEPFEVLVAHRSTRARFDEATDAEIEVVARSTHEVLRRLAALLGDAAYNLVIHTAPPAARPGFHWYVRITPRLSVIAGFERGTGLFVNIVPPENAAAALREVPAP